MKALAPERRWHTLDGQRTSPYFVAPRDDRIKVVGIDASAPVVGLDDRGESHLAPEKASYVNNSSEIHTVAPVLIPIAATLGGFINGYCARCDLSR